MQRKLLIFSGIYSVLLVLELLAGTLLSGIGAVHLFTKPSLLISLIIFFLLHRKEVQSKARIWMMLALHFSLAGDVLLMFQADDPLFFLLGLVAFLLGHVSYVIAFLRGREGKPKLFDSKAKIGFYLLALAYGIGFFLYLEPHLGPMKIPVAVYELVILCMGVTALLRWGSTAKASFWLVFAGALCFMLSDSILAVNKFALPLPLSHLLIMSTYGIAQLLIVAGMLRSKE